MSLIQLLLLGGIGGALFLYLGFFRSVLLDRLIALALFALAATFIMMPRLTTALANLLGVGRGTDLLVYFAVIVAFFKFVLVHSRIAKLEQIQTDLVRHVAMLSATPPPERDMPKSKPTLAE